MSTENIEVLTMRLDSLERAVASVASNVETHLREGSGVRSDIEWLKKIVWVLLATSLSTFATLIVYLLTHR